MTVPNLQRRKFLKGMLAGAAGLGATGQPARAETRLPNTDRPATGKDYTGKDYTGPNVIVIRFGGGARRRETIDPKHTYSPFFCHDFAKRGTLFSNVEIGSDEVETSHGSGTLNILTGIYDRYEDVGQRFLGERFEAKVPTLFEYLRKTYNIPEHQTLIVNGEDRTDEEFYTFSNHHLFGVQYRSNVLSLYRFKTYLLRRQIEAGAWTGEQLDTKKRELHELEALDHRLGKMEMQSPQLSAFWDEWRAFYGETGLVNPRGDRLLTELAVRAIRRLRPKLIMVNYNDCDYVHWGNMTHYTRGIAIMDAGLRRIVQTVEADEQYRDNTVFVVVPDCGRDNNPLMSVPCQHHFGSRASREIFALLVGPGIESGQVIDRTAQQIDVAPTIAAIMKFRPELATGTVLTEALI